MLTILRKHTILPCVRAVATVGRFKTEVLAPSKVCAGGTTPGAARMGLFLFQRYLKKSLAKMFATCFPSGMSNTALLTAFHEALESGDTAETLRLANLVDFIAAAPVIAPRIIDTIAADNATGWKAQKASRIERLILMRDEQAMHGI